MHVCAKMTRVRFKMIPFRYQLDVSKYVVKYSGFLCESALHEMNSYY